MSATVPETIGNFKIVSKLGQGGMGAVYKAMHGTLERHVALKILPAEFSNNPEYVMRFLREARTIATLRNDNVVQVYDAGEQNGQYFIAMELVDGCNLLKYVENRKVPEEEGLELLLQAAKGLAAAHTKNLVHRDIKPENLLLGKDKILRIVDFGLVMESSSTTQLTATGACLGTPMYMSPEQADGEQADARTDLYSLGVTFYRVFTGQAPFTSPTVMNLLFKHKFEAPPNPKSMRADLSDDVSNLLLHMMGKRREDRPASAQAVIDLIEGLKTGKHIPAPPPFTGTLPSSANLPTVISGSPARVSGSSHKRSVLVALAAVALLAVVALVLFLRRGDKPATVVEAPPAQTDPAQPAVNLRQEGDIAFAGGRFQDAIERYREALSADPQNTELQDKITRVRRKIDFQDQVKHAEAAEAVGDLDEALHRYTQAQTFDDGGTAAGEVARIKARQAAARAAAAATPLKQPSERDVVFKQAQEAERKGLFEAAADAYSRAAALSDGTMRTTAADLAANCRRQDCLAKAFAAETAKDYAGAIAFYERAQSLKSDPIVAEKLAFVQKRQQDLVALRELDVKYAEAMRDGQLALEAANYRQARVYFGVAKGLKSDQRAPVEKLAEIARLEEKLRVRAMVATTQPALDRADALVRGDNDAEALAAIASALAKDPASEALKNMKAGIECVQACGAVFGELAKITGSADDSLGEALEIDDEDRTRDIRETYHNMRARFEEHGRNARPLLLEHNFASVKACLETARKDAAQLAEELGSSHDYFEKCADKAGDKATVKVPLIKINLGGDSKKAEKYRKIGDAFKKLVERAKALKE